MILKLEVDDAQPSWNWSVLIFHGKRSIAMLTRSFELISFLRRPVICERKSRTIATFASGTPSNCVINETNEFLMASWSFKGKEICRERECYSFFLFRIETIKKCLSRSKTRFAGCLKERISRKMRATCLEKILLGLKFSDYAQGGRGCDDARGSKEGSNFFSDKFTSTTAIIITLLFLT